MGREAHYDVFKKNKSTSLKKIRHFAEYLILICLQKFAALWSLRMNQRFGKWFGDLAYLFARKDRGIAAYQIDFCFPELSQVEKNRLVRQTFQGIGKTFFETLIAQRLRETPEKHITLLDEDVVYKALQAGKGAVLLFGHVGNWELLATVSEMLNIRGIAVESLVGDNKLDDLLLSVRKTANIVLVPRGDRSSARSILSCFRNNEVFFVCNGSRYAG